MSEHSPTLEDPRGVLLHFSQSSIASRFPGLGGMSESPDRHDRLAEFSGPRGSMVLAERRCGLDALKPESEFLDDLLT